MSFIAKSKLSDSKLSQKVINILVVTGCLSGVVTLSAYAQKPQSVQVSKPAKVKVVSLQGDVNKTLEIFSLSTKQSQRYHIYDPDNFIDGMARQHGVKSGYYQLNGVCLKGNLSNKGDYGHLGQFERQFTVIGGC